MDSLYVLAAGLAALAGLGVAATFARQVTGADPGSPRMIELMEAIREGAMAFLRRQYSVLAIFVVVVAGLIFAIPEYRLLGAFAYVLGAFSSAGAGFVGMRIATRANARTAKPPALAASSAHCRSRSVVAPSWASALPGSACWA